MVDREIFRPFKTGISLIKRLPFDILCGTSMIREAILNDLPIEKIEMEWQKELADFLKLRAAYLMY